MLLKALMGLISLKSAEIFDNFCLNRNAEELTIGRALRYTLFWISTAFAFCGWVWYTYGRSGAFMWMSEGLRNAGKRPRNGLT